MSHTVSLNSKVLQVLQLADILTKFYLANLIVLIGSKRERLQELEVAHFLRKRFATLQVEHAELHGANTAQSLRMGLHEIIGSLPKGYAAPVAHVVARIVGNHATQLLVDHDDRERVARTVILNLRCSFLANRQDYVFRRISISIHQLVFCLDRNQVDLSHTNGRNHVHRPAELEVDAARTILSIQHDAQVGTLQLVFILTVQEPAFTLALVLSLLGIGHVSLEGILNLSNLAFHVGRNQTLECTVIVRIRVLDFHNRFLQEDLLAITKLGDGKHTALSIGTLETEFRAAECVGKSRIHLDGTLYRAHAVGWRKHQPRLRGICHPVLRSSDGNLLCSSLRTYCNLLLIESQASWDFDIILIAAGCEKPGSENDT